MAALSPTVLLAHAGSEAGPWVFNAYWEVWLLMGAILVGWQYTLRRYGPVHAAPGEAISTARQNAWFLGGVATLWLFADWPVHGIAERYLFSVHMLQHTMFSLVAPAMLLMGTPRWLWRLILSPPWFARIARFATKPVVAGLVFNAVVVVTHLPIVVDTVTPNELYHFLAHVVLFTAALAMWFPVVNREEGFSTMPYPAKGVYLFLQSIIPTVPASFLTFAEGSLYTIYAQAPRVFNIGVTEDQQLAAAVMKVGGVAILWGAILAIFFLWYSHDQADSRADGLTWDVVEDAFAKTPPAADPLDART